jgi:hypothetical protein
VLWLSSLFHDALSSSYIVWRIDPLLGKDLETDETTAVAMQYRGTHALQQLELLLETVFSTRSVPRETIGATQLTESQSVKRRLGDWCEMVASLGVSCQLRSVWEAVKRRRYV